MNALRTAGAALAAALAIVPAQAQSRRHNLNVNINGNAASCADVRVSTDGALAQAVDRFSVPGSSIQIDAGTNGAIYVAGADRGDYGVEACRYAVAGDQAAAQQAVNGISVTHSSWRVETNGPAYSEGTHWQVYFIVQAPRNGSVELNTVNGPLSVRGVNGAVKVKAVNGPVAVSDCSGMVDAQTTNGPISFAGDGGDVKLSAVNGPMSVKIKGDIWNGTRLEATTMNGPVDFQAPDTFRSSVRLETNGDAPFSCKAGICRSALTDISGEKRTLEMNGSADTIHLSTGNGPVSVRTLAASFQ